MSSSPPTDPVESITLRLGNLELTLTARPIAGASRASSVGSFELVEHTGGAEVVARSSTYYAPGGAGSEHQPDEGERLRTLALQAEGPTALSQLPLNHLSYLLGKLRGSDKLWTPAARIGRAFKAGSVARIRLEGGVSGISSEGIPFRNSYYVVLQGPDKSPGFWTNSYTTYINRVGVSVGGVHGLHPDSISHAWATHAESEAYLAGAGLPWPRKLD